MLQGAENVHTHTTPNDCQPKRRTLADFSPGFSAGTAGLQQAQDRPDKGFFLAIFNVTISVNVMLRWFCPEGKGYLIDRFPPDYLSDVRRVYIHYHTITPIPYALCSFMRWIGRSKTLSRCAFTAGGQKIKYADARLTAPIVHRHLLHSWGDYSASVLREPHMRNIEICPKSPNISMYSCIHVLLCPI